MIELGEVTLLLSDVLGTKGMSRRIRRALGELGVRWRRDITVEPRDYGSVPFFARHLGESRLVIHAAIEALRRHDLPEGGLVIVNGWENGLAALRDPRSLRVVLAMDTFPDIGLLRGAGLLDGGPVTSGLRRMSVSVSRRAYARESERVVGLLPVSHSVARAAIRTFQAADEIPCHVTSSPQPLIATDSGHRWPSNELRAVMVGNDLRRKRGEVFADACARASIRGRVRGVLVSNDPAARSISDAYGLELVTGVRDPERVHQLFRDADVSVLPTDRDHYPNVVAESMAAGTPVIATDVGGISEMVKHDRTGWLLPRGASAQELAQTLVRVSEEADLGRIRAETIEFARATLSWSGFLEGVEGVLRATAVALG